MRRFALFMIMVLTVVFAAASAEAIEGNTRKGKFLFRKNCRSCHGVKASDLSPSSKTQAQWKAMYDNPGSVPCAKDWPAMSDEEKKDIFAYAYGFAKDSPTPAKCE